MLPTTTLGFQTFAFIYRQVIYYLYYIGLELGMGITQIISKQSARLLADFFETCLVVDVEMVEIT